MKSSDREWVNRLSAMSRTSSLVDAALYTKYDVKRGLRDINGKGVLAGLTNIGDVIGQTVLADSSVPGPGKLTYRGIDINDIVGGFWGQGRSGFEETCYLLLFGRLPDCNELGRFNALLSSMRKLPHAFVHDSIFTLSSPDIMNAMAQTVLSLYVLDKHPDAIDIPNVLQQSLFLTAVFPLVAVYCYRAHAYRYGNRSLIIHSPQSKLSTAANLLQMLRDDSAYTPLEEQLLDLALVLHAEHGGGNNSSFATHVVTSSGTDTYSAITAALGSLKGPLHGGANIKVVQMIDDLKKNVANWEDEKQIEDYLNKLVGKTAFDRSGLIYGFGHAVYSVSDPRTLILRRHVKDLAREKGKLAEFELYEKIETLAPGLIGSKRKIYKGVSANVDFYSGFLYRLLGIPSEMFTPLFAVSRIVGWCAHRIEELANGGKIIRPAYKSVTPEQSYVPFAERKGVPQE